MRRRSAARSLGFLSAALVLAASRERARRRVSAGHDWPPVRLVGLPQQRADVRDGHHGGERPLARATAGRARRNGRLLADLPARRAGSAARRTTSSSSRRRTARRSRSTPRSGNVLWRFTPPGYSSWAGSAQITTATPVADPAAQWIYAAAPDGRIHKLAVADGHAVVERVDHEAPVAREDRGVAQLRERPRDRDDRRLHRRRAAVPGARRDRSSSSGQLLHVWNSLCSNRTG